MKTYHVCVGAYARVYCSYDIEARDDDAALQAAIDKFKDDDDDIMFDETDWSNIAMPSIVSIEHGDNTIIEGHDFALTEDDHRDMAAGDMLTALTKAQAFIAGFEGDETQDGIDDLLQEINTALEKARGAQARGQTVQAGHFMDDVIEYKEATGADWSEALAVMNVD